MKAELWETRPSGRKWSWLTRCLWSTEDGSMESRRSRLRVPARVSWRSRDGPSRSTSACVEQRRIEPFGDLAHPVKWVQWFRWSLALPNSRSPNGHQSGTDFTVHSRFQGLRCEPNAAGSGVKVPTPLNPGPSGVRVTL